MDDPCNLKKIKSTQEIEQSVLAKTFPLLFFGVGFMFGGPILYKEIPFYRGPDALLTLAGILLVVWAVVVWFYESRHASREQMLKIIHRAQGFPDIKNLLCAYLEKRDYLTVDEYDRFRLKIERSKEKQKEQQANLEWEEALQSMCNQKH